MALLLYQFVHQSGIHQVAVLDMEPLVASAAFFVNLRRKMLIDGYIIVVDYTEQKKLAAEINKIGVNINTVCRRINSTGRFYQDDIDELKEKMDAVWQLLKSKQSEEL